MTLKQLWKIIYEIKVQIIRINTDNTDKKTKNYNIKSWNYEMSVIIKLRVKFDIQSQKLILKHNWQSKNYEIKNHNYEIKIGIWDS